MSASMVALLGFLQPPDVISADRTAFWLFTAATMVLVVAAVVLLIRETMRLRSSLPIVVFVSAALWLPNEPFVDAMLGFQYASDGPVTLFHLWGRAIPPAVLGVGAMFFIFPWAIYQMMLRGTTNRNIVAVALAAGLIDWALEWAAIAQGLFVYYGNNPTRVLGLPLTSMVQNCFIYVLMASVVLLAAPYLTGWRQLLFLPVIPGLYLAGTALCTWPQFLALHGGWPPIVFTPLAVVSAAMNAYIPMLMLNFAASVRAAPLELETGPWAARDALRSSSS